MSDNMSDNDICCEGWKYWVINTLPNIDTHYYVSYIMPMEKSFKICPWCGKEKKKK